METAELREILDNHMKWRAREGGECADLRGADLRSADLGGADLVGADLVGADLMDADLRSADLIDADLVDADLRSADLRGANLRSADLGGADLRGANLRCADLRSADLRGADLGDANLGDANLRGAKCCLCLPVGDPRGYRPVAVWVGGGWRVYAGCRSLTIAMSREHWGGDDYHTPTLGAQYVAAMDWLEKQPEPVKAEANQ